MCARTDAQRCQGRAIARVEPASLGKLKMKSALELPEILQKEWEKEREREAAGVRRNIRESARGNGKTKLRGRGIEDAAVRLSVC